MLFRSSEVLAEAAAMTGKPQAIVEMVHAQEIVLKFDLSAQAAGVQALLQKYEDVPMDLPDACIVRMTELIRDCTVITVDRKDCGIYRRNGRGEIPIVAPPR